MNLHITLFAWVSFATSNLFGAEPPVDFIATSRAKDRDDQRRIIALIVAERERTVGEIRKILTNEHATEFQKCFALEVVAQLRLSELQDLVIPLVGMHFPLINPSADKDPFVGAKAVASFGESGRSAVLKGITGNEDLLTIECISIVVGLVDGRENGLKVLTKIESELGGGGRDKVIALIREKIATVH